MSSLRRESLAEETLSKRRERKPNFSDAEIGVILEGVCEHKDVLSHQENSLTLNKRKTEIYNLITSKVNRVTVAEYGGSVRRTPKEVKKKWMELKFTALKVHHSTVDDGEELKNIPKESPYHQLVLDILSGKAKTGTTDFQLGYNSSNRSGPGRAHSSESDLAGSPPSVLSTCESENSSCVTSDDESSNSKHQQNSDLVTCTKTREDTKVENPTVELGTGISASSLRNEKSSNNTSFSELEIETLLREISKNRKVLLRGDQQSSSTQQQQKLTWELVTESVGKASEAGVHCTVPQIQRMWQMLKSRACRELQTTRNVASKGSKPAVYSQYTSQVLAILDGNSDDASVSEVQELDFDAMMSMDASSENEMNLPKESERYILATSEDQLEQKRRTRKPNFTETEVSCMLDEIPRHYRILLSAPRTDNVLLLKQKRWQMIAERVSKVSDPGVKRSWKEVRKKFKALCSLAQSSKNTSQSEGGSPTSSAKDSKFFQRVLQIQAVASGSKAPSGAETIPVTETDSQEDVDTEQFSRRKRERKKNFTNEDVRLLVDECCKHRSVLMAKDRDDVTNRKRNQAWRIITETVNKKIKGVRRTAKELKKKFMDMKSAAAQYAHSMSKSTNDHKKPPPYFSELSTFVSGSKEDGPALSSENDFNVENEFIIAAEEEKSDSDDESVDDSSSDKESSDDSDYDGDSQNQNADDRASMESSNSASLRQSSRGSDSFFECTSGQKKRIRKPNFTKEEVSCILDVWNSNRALLSQKQSDMATVKEKLKVFQLMADRINQASDDSIAVRTALEIKKKWKALKHLALKTWLSRQDAISKGKKLPKKVPFMNRIVETISEEGMLAEVACDLQKCKDDKGNKELEADVAIEAENEREDTGTLVQRYMRCMAQICGRLRACGVRAGALIIENDGIMSWGEETTKISKLAEVATVISSLPPASEQQSQESSIRGGWKYTPFGSTTELPVVLAEESSEQKDHKDSSGGSHLAKVVDGAKLLVKSSEDGSGDFEDNKSTSQDSKGDDASPHGNVTFVEDQDLILDVKEKLRLLLQNRPTSVDEQQSGLESTEQKGVSQEPSDETEVSGGPSISDVETHVKIEKEGPYVCTWCGKTFSQLSSFILHTQEGKERRFTCIMCDKRFCDVLDLKEHEITAHDKLPAEAGEKMTPVVLLEKLSESTISSATGFQGCFPQQALESKFGCSECGQCFLNMDILLQHRRIHTQERPFACRLCDMRFKLQATLDAHRGMHSTGIPYNCHVCGEQYNTGAELVVHKHIKGCSKVYLPRIEDNDADPEKQKVKSSGVYNHSIERRFSCGICGKRFLRASHLGQHLRLHAGSKPYSCDQCGATFTQHGGLLLHKKTKHQRSPRLAGFSHSQLDSSGTYLKDGYGRNDGDDEDCIVMEDGSRSASQDDDQAVDSLGFPMVSRTRRYGCEFCGKRFFTSSHRRQHVRIHTGERPFKCDICGFCFTQSTSLTIHKRKHTGERPYACDICGYSFYCSSDVLSHKKKRHGLVAGKREDEQEDKYRCELCGQVFSDTTRLKVHTRKHTGEKPFECDMCDRKFTEKHNLLRHKDRHLGIRAFQCEVCGAKFTEKGNMKVHMRYHTGEKPYKCEFCGEAFYVTSTLKIHRRKHTGERPFLCDLCGASFTQGSKLRSHRRKHTGEKPYKCDECGETFKEKQQLNVHNRKHTGEQPYRCSVCGKVTQKASHLAVHMRLHTGERPYKCEVCSESFARSDVLKLHMRKHSSETQTAPAFGPIPMADHMPGGLEMVLPLPGMPTDLTLHPAVPQGYPQL